MMITPLFPFLIFLFLNPVPRNCHEAARNSKIVFPDRFYKTIDPDGDGGVSPFIVECSFYTDKSRVKTIVHHDHEARAHVNGLEPVGSYGAALTYRYANLSQVTALVNVSSSCKQSIKYECHGSMISDGYWINRSGDKMLLWPKTGLAEGKKYCDLKSKDCACDINDKKWRVDEGFVENNAARTLNSLPIKAVHFGDTGGGDEQGYHTIGPLMCY